MRFTFTVEVEALRVIGELPVGRDELARLIQDELNDANPVDLVGENESLYKLTSWDVSQSGDKS